MEEHIPWQWLLLGILDNYPSHKATLHDIYIRVEEDYQDFIKNGTQLIKPKLLDVERKYGDRPKYQHTVRGCLSSYKKHGWVNRIDKAIYQLTDEGKKRLEWVMKNAK